MKSNVKFTEDQEAHIESTLTRIRRDLRQKQSNQFEEPAQLFVPEVFHAEKK